MAAEQFRFLTDKALQHWLADGTDLPFVYGRCDCALWVGDWLMHFGYDDPFAAYRGRYSTKLGCARLLKREGGLLRLATRAFRAIGLPRVDCPDDVKRGDVGCLETPVGQVLAIAAFGGRWACKSDPGVTVTADHAPLRSWSA